MDQPFVKDEIEIANIYQQMLNEDMTAGGVYGGDVAGHAGIENTDWFAPGDARNPYGMGITTRKGKLKRKRKKLKQKKITENYQYTGNCTEYDDGMEIQQITRHDDWSFPEETYGHDPEMQISAEDFQQMTEETLKDGELAFWNQDMNIIFRYNPDEDVHYFYEKY